MTQSTRFQSIAALLLAGAASLPLLLGQVSCGGGEKPAEAPSNASESSSSASSAASETAAGDDAGPAEPAAPAEAASASSPPAASAGSTKISTKNDPSWASCHGSVKMKGKDKTVSADVALLAKACAKTTKMKVVGKTISGKQSDSGQPQTYPLKAVANHCYRVYAQAGDGVKDLDVAIKDSAGNVAGEDSTDSPTAVVLEDGAVCFKEADAAQVVVSVGSGAGAYALQIWGD
jgi:hypothetical protein